LNTSLEIIKPKLEFLEKTSHKLETAKRDLNRKHSNTLKEKEGLEMHLNLFKKLPVYRESKQGYLWKEGNLLQEWKRRFFRIKNGELVYYKEGREVSYISLFLSKVKELHHHEQLFAFEVYSASSQKTATLLAESQHEMEEWLFSLKQTGEQDLVGESSVSAVCADCLTKNGEWCSTNLGVILCTSCSGIHRGLGSHISRVKSLCLDSLSSETLAVISKLHTNSDSIWGSGQRPPVYASYQERETYIKKKYLDKEFMEKVSNPSDLLSQGIAEGNLVKVAKAVFAGAELKETLHEACRTGNLELVELLVLTGCQLEGKNKEGLTPLEIALLNSQNTVVNHIVKILDLGNT